MTGASLWCNNFILTLRSHWAEEVWLKVVTSPQYSTLLVKVDQEKCEWLWRISVVLSVEMRWYCYVTVLHQEEIQTSTNTLLHHTPASMLINVMFSVQNLFHLNPSSFFMNNILSLSLSITSRGKLFSPCYKAIVLGVNYNTDQRRRSSDPGSERENVISCPRS